MEGQSFRVLVVDDYESFRRFLSSTLENNLEVRSVHLAEDGLEAVQKAEELQPDLILLDIGLPTVNGVEAARQIRKASPKSKIVFVSQESSIEVIEEALSTGAEGYVVKIHAGREPMPAVKAVLQGQRFVGRVRNHAEIRVGEREPLQRRESTSAQVELPVSKASHCHEARFYSNDAALLDHLSQFISTALDLGNAAIVIATESHRESLSGRLQERGVDVATAIRHGRYISLDAADTLSMIMHNRLLDPARFMAAFGNLIVTAAKTIQREYPRIAVFGECVDLLLARGNAEAAIQMEKLGNQLANFYDVDILCGFSLARIQAEVNSRIFERICAEHSSCYSL